MLSIPQKFRILPLSLPSLIALQQESLIQAQVDKRLKELTSLQTCTETKLKSQRREGSKSKLGSNGPMNLYLLAQIKNGLVITS